MKTLEIRVVFDNIDKWYGIKGYDIYPKTRLLVAVQLNGDKLVFNMDKMCYYVIVGEDDERSD